MPESALCTTASTTSASTATMARVIASAAEIDDAAITTTRANTTSSTESRPNAAPRPTLPIAFSPQVRLSRATLSLIASIGPTLRCTSTGTTKKVDRVQATPSPLPSMRTRKLFSRLLSACSSMPTVAAIAA